MDNMDVSTSGTFQLKSTNKKTMCKWKMNVKPKKKGTFKVRADVHVNDKHTAVDVDASINKDKTVNLQGNVTTKQGKTTITHPIDVTNYKPGTPLPSLKMF